jgi:hypothetical protein
MTMVPLVVFLSVAAPAAGTSPDPGEILARVKQASGGAAWDRITTTHTRATIETGGLKGPEESWDDTRTGRSVNHYQLGPIEGGGGFDGKTVWSQDTSKQVRIEQGGEAQEDAANEAYRACLGYFFPERWPARLEFGGEQVQGERHFLVVRITPERGRPFDFWVDRATNLIDRAVEKASVETQTTHFSDYRKVGGVWYPFSVRLTNGEEKYDQRSTLQSVEFNAPIEAARFAPPPPPPPDFAISTGSSTTIPFDLLGNHIYVQVKLNGKGPFRMLCDTGGVNIVTPELATQLGLKSEGTVQGRGVGEASEDMGAVKVDSLSVGDATIQNQVFMVFPLVSDVPTDGLVGYEIFKRFVVTVDYEHSRLTLTLPAAFNYAGNGTLVPFRFNERVPQVDGEIDGVPGTFDIDTGSRASIGLLGPFVEKNNLRAKYAPKVEGVTSWGVGGPVRSQVTRAKVLKLGAVTVSNPVVALTRQQKGVFTDPHVAGNVGAGVLKRFNIVFDYPQQRLILEPNANDAKPDVFDRSGLWVNQGDAGFEIMDVVAGGPGAAAGLKVGDVIVAVDGKPATTVALLALRLRFRTDPAGTRVILKVRSGAQEKELGLVLRDLV